MHEYNITHTIVDIIKDKIKVLKNPVVKSVYIELGDLVGYDSESIIYYFNFLSKGTPLEKAKLIFDIKKPRVKCNDCGKEFSTDKWLMYECPECHSNNLTIVSGEEFFIKYIEVDYGEN